MNDREEIISCSENAYKELSISDAKQLFMASLDSEIEEIIREVGIHHCAHSLNPSNLYVC